MVEAEPYSLENELFDFEESEELFELLEELFELLEELFELLEELFSVADEDALLLSMLLLFLPPHDANDTTIRRIIHSTARVFTFMFFTPSESFTYLSFYTIYYILYKNFYQ